jgi:restriction endonuclease S subunit
MIVDIVDSILVSNSNRLDSHFFISKGNSVLANLAKSKENGLASELLGVLAKSIWSPNRFRRSYANDKAHAVPYLRPYDVFNYFPEAADWLIPSQVKNINTYRVSPGMILQTCSGRNLGPAVMVDTYLSRFLLSDDIMRIEIDDINTRNYILAYLNSNTGRQLLRKNKTGSVIDHISDSQISSLEVVFINNDSLQQVSELMNLAVYTREQSRITLSDLLRKYEDKLPKYCSQQTNLKGWEIRSDILSGRIDAAFYSPIVNKTRDLLLQIGGIRLGDIANVIKPGGRIKLRYVSKENGTPLLSGSQLLQTYPINLQFISKKSLSKFNDYVLHSNTIAYPADGRAEEGLGTPIYITDDRSNWLASGHIGRIIPKEGVDIGWLFLALKTSQAQMQIKSKASGSVVDSTFPNDMEDIILPPSLGENYQEVIALWENFAKAQAMEENAISIIDKILL